MDEINEDLELYMDERMQKNLEITRNQEEYKKTKNIYNEKYNNFYESLSVEKKLELEEISDLRYAIFQKDMYLSYKRGFIDGIKLDKNLL